MQLQMKFESSPLSKTLPRQFEKAAAVALTRTAWDVQKSLTEEMKSVFDNPTAFTLRAFKVDMAKAGDLTATVYAQEQQAKYLRHEVEGGERNTKGFERKLHLFGGQVALPGAGAKLNQHGNMSLSFIKRVTDDATKPGGKYFIGTPKGWNSSGMFEGVWTRGSDGGLTRVMAFEDKASYEPRLDVLGVATHTVDKVFASRLAAAIGQYVGE